MVLIRVIMSVSVVVRQIRRTTSSASRLWQLSQTKCPSVQQALAADVSPQKAQAMGRPWGKYSKGLPHRMQPPPPHKLGWG